jgi:hypothetical protein
MPVSKLRWIKQCIEFCPQKEAEDIPHKIRGLYVLYNAPDMPDNKPDKQGRHKRYDVAYVGIAFGEKVGGVHGRIKKHLSSERKRGKWTHFSVFKVWENVRGDELRELEGLLRHLYRKHPGTNSLAKAKSYQRLKNKEVRVNDLKQLGNAPERSRAQSRVDWK